MLKIYGAGDDLIEIEGHIRGEIARRKKKVNNESN